MTLKIVPKKKKGPIGPNFLVGFTASLFGLEFPAKTGFQVEFTFASLLERTSLVDLTFEAAESVIERFVLTDYCFWHNIPPSLAAC